MRKMSHHTKNPIVVREDPDTIVFRGKDDLENVMRRYDKSIQKMNKYIDEQCQNQIEALNKAQAELEAKLETVMSDTKLKEMENNAQRENDAVNKQMKYMKKEFERMEDEIENANLDSDTRNAQLLTLHKAARSHYADLSKKYPAAMKAQILSSIRLLH
jgi:predicted nuclease with TOPRIM domain